MIVTEAEAKLLACCGPQTVTPARKWSDRCSGTRCMAWVWLQENGAPVLKDGIAVGTCGLVREYYPT